MVKYALHFCPNNFEIKTNTFYNWCERPGDGAVVVSQRNLERRLRNDLDRFMWMRSLALRLVSTAFVFVFVFRICVCVCVSYLCFSSLHICMSSQYCVNFSDVMRSLFIKDFNAQLHCMNRYIYAHCVYMFCTLQHTM